jgi:hypothetical protein
MNTTEMTREQWTIAHILASNLALLNVSKNLVLGLQEYLARHPEATPDDYLERLVQLGDAFAGGEDELRQRRELSRIVRRAARSAPDAEWLPVLSWAARLMVAYRPEERGRPTQEQEREIKARIQRELEQALEQLEEPYYG